MKRAFFTVAALVAGLSILWAAHAVWTQTTPQTESFNEALEALRSNRLGLAIAHLERVTYYSPGDVETRTLLRSTREQLQERLSKKYEEVSENHGTALESFSAVAAPVTWAALLLASLCAMLCAFAVGLWLTPSNLRTGLVSLGVLLLAASFTCGLGWLGKRSALSPGLPAIVHLPDAKTLHNPDSRAQVTGELLEGERVWIMEGYPDFVRVQRGDGSSGWVNKSAVQSISVID